MPAKRNTIPRICEHCAEPFFARQDQVKRGDGRYCSVACASRAFGATNRGEHNACWKGGLGARKNTRPTVERACEQCGKLFAAARYAVAAGNARYCCRSCGMRARSGEKCPRWKGGPVERTCAHCGLSFMTTQAKIAQGKAHFCCKECSYRGRCAENHWRWKGGSQTYYGPNWGDQRRAARERDGYRCQECGRGRDELTRLVSVHHVVAFRTFGIARYEEANRLGNLICLCGSCHMKREHREKTAARLR